MHPQAHIHRYKQIEFHQDNSKGDLVMVRTRFALQNAKVDLSKGCNSAKIIVE